MLQKNVGEDIRGNRKAECKFWRKKVKELVNESNKKVNEEFIRKLYEGLKRTRNYSGKK